MPKYYKFLLLIITLLSITSCRSILSEINLAQPSASESEYFSTAGMGFVVKAQDHKILSSYALTLLAKKPLPENAFLEVYFENPNDSSKPFIVTHVVKLGEKEIKLESEPFFGIKAYHNYEAKVYLYKDETKSELITTHRQLAQSIIQDSYLPST